jgi:hypothetical protein
MRNSTKHNANGQHMKLSCLLQVLLDPKGVYDVHESSGSNVYQLCSKFFFLTKSKVYSK